MEPILQLSLVFVGKDGVWVFFHEAKDFVVLIPRRYMKKRELRERMLELREGMLHSEVAAMSKTIHTYLQSLPSFRNAKNIFLYASTRNEVETDDIIVNLLQAGKGVAIPVVNKGTKEIVFSFIESLDELMPSTYGIREPLPNSLRPVALDSVDLIIIPGVAFDMRGYRLGYGGGYYDRFLEKLPEGVHKMGLAFDFQVLEALPVEEHDLKVDTIITEERIIKVE